MTPSTGTSITSACVVTELKSSNCTIMTDISAKIVVHESPTPVYIEPVAKHSSHSIRDIQVLKLCKRVCLTVVL